MLTPKVDPRILLFIPECVVHLLQQHLHLIRALLALAEPLFLHSVTREEQGKAKDHKPHCDRRQMKPLASALGSTAKHGMADGSGQTKQYRKDDSRSVKQKDVDVKNVKKHDF